MIFKIDIKYIFTIYSLKVTGANGMNSVLANLVFNTFDMFTKLGFARMLRWQSALGPHSERPSKRPTIFPRFRWSIIIGMYELYKLLSINLLEGPRKKKVCMTFWFF
jgi:hypothetical protein